MKKLMAVACLAVLAACGGGSTSGPSSVEQPATVAAAPATAPAAPQTVTAPGGIDVRWGQSASWVLTNGSADTLRYTAQWTDFDNQALVRGSLDGVVAPGKTSEGSFDRGCAQVDLVAGNGIFAFAFFDKAGRAFDPGTHPERIAECRPQPTPKPSPSPTPTPTPTPSPTPTPCPTPTPKPVVCTYTIDCGKQDSPLAASTHANYCVQHSAEAECVVGGGAMTGSKCVTGLPGVSNLRWQLTPGQSDARCLNKH